MSSHIRVHARHASFSDRGGQSRYPTFRFPFVGILSPNVLVPIACANSNHDTGSLRNRYLDHVFPVNTTDGFGKGKYHVFRRAADISELL